MLPLVVGLLRRSWTHPLSLIVLLVAGITLGVEQTALSLWHQGKNNLWVYHLLAPIEIILWLWFYQKVLWAQSPKWLWGIAVVMVVGLAMGNSIWLQNPFQGQFNSHVTTFLALLMILLAITYFIQQLRSPAAGNQSFLLLVNSSHLLYYSGALFLFFAFQTIQGDSKVTSILFILNSTFNILRMTLLAFALWLKPQPLRNHS